MMKMQTHPGLQELLAGKEPRRPGCRFRRRKMKETVASEEGEKPWRRTSLRSEQGLRYHCPEVD